VVRLTLFVQAGAAERRELVQASLDSVAPSAAI
jgi:hypothetical protein